MDSTIKMRYSRIVFLVVCSLIVPLSVFGQISVVGELARDIDGSPGKVIKGEIEVHNGSPVDREAKVYKSDYMFFHDGTNRFSPPGTEVRSNAAWVDFSPERFIVPPGQSVMVSYVVTIPDTTLDGTYWSMLMVEGIPEESPESVLDDSDEPKVGLIQIFRYGVQIATHIRGSEDYSISFADVAIADPGSGEKALKVSVDNTGNMFVKPEVWVELFDKAGKKTARREANPARVYPGTSVSYWFDIQDITPGEYEALIVVDAGGENVFGAQYTVGL